MQISAQYPSLQSSAVPRATRPLPSPIVASPCSSTTCSRRCTDALSRTCLGRLNARSRRLMGGVRAGLRSEDESDDDTASRPKRDGDKLTIGIVGFGVFGQFLAKRMVRAGHRVMATSRTDYQELAKAMGVEFYTDPNDFCEEHPEVVMLCTSILSLDSVLDGLPLLRLKRRTLVVDVLSVKVFPKQLLLQKLPPDFDIVCTHPMFGPDSGKESWKDLNFMYERVRVGKDPARQQRVEKFLKFFAAEDCNMVEMSCEDHDYASASCQFVTHTVGRMLGLMKLQSTAINTKGFEALLSLVEQTNSDSFELYYGLFLYNQNATDELERLENGLERVKKSLFSKLHDIAREEMFPQGMGLKPEPAKQESPK